MNMKKLAVLLGVAVSAPLMATQALALAPNVTPDRVFYISGASATSKTLPKLLAAPGFCAAGTVDNYSDVSGGAVGKNWKGVFCTIDPAGVAPASLKGLNVLFMERVKGGSGWGPYPVDNGYYVEQLNISTTNCTLVGSKYECTWDANRSASIVGDECPLGGGNPGGTVLGATTADTICVVSHGGVSDEEAEMFADGAPSIPATFPPQASFPNLTQNKFFGVVFQPVITEDVYRELQHEQFNGDANCDPAIYDLEVNPLKSAAGGPTLHDLNGDGVISGAEPVPATRFSETHPECQPTLTEAAVRSILDKEIDNWNDMLNKTAESGSGFGAMGVCRRTPGSGTQAAYHAYFMDDPCGKNPIQGAARPFVTETGDTGGLFFVSENSSSGKVIDCMDEMFDGTRFGAQIGSIGVQSVEKQPEHGVAWTDPSFNHWDFVKLNGINSGLTTGLEVENVLDGTYEFWYENSFHWNTGTCTGDCLDAMSMIATNGAEATFIYQAGGTGLAGVVALHGNGANDWKNWNPASEQPVARATRGGNSCRGVFLNK